MRTLGIHTDYLRYEAKEKATKSAEKIASTSGAVNEECIVIYIGVDKEDEKNPDVVARKLVNDTKKRAKQLNVNNIVVYP